MAGTSVDYAVKVKDIRKRVLPALDDEFAKDVGEFDTLEALRERIAAGPRSAKRKRKPTGTCAATC